MSGHTQPIHGVSFTNDGKRLVSVSSDRTIRLWDGESGKPMDLIAKHSAPLESLASCPNDRFLAIGAWDGSIILWDMVTAREAARLTRSSISPWDLAFSFDGKNLAFGIGDNSIRLWDIGLMEKLSEGSEKRTQLLNNLYQVSLYLFPYQFKNSNLLPKQPKLYLSPVNEYKFPKPSYHQKIRKLLDPRPIGKDPIIWILENG